MHLRRSVNTLNEQNKRLEEQIAQLQRQVDEQGGEIKILIEFVQTSLRNEIETRAERAAIDMIDRLITRRHGGSQREKE